MNKLALSLVAATILLSANSLAQSEGETLDEIVVTAAPLGRTADDLTQPTMVLDKEALLLKAAASIGETLSTELGVSSTYFGPVAGRPVIRGQAGPRISVLQAGVGTLDVADLSPDHAVPVEPLFADRIEIIRGPATLLYGSAAAGGVVNVIDNRIPEVIGEKPLTGAVELRADSVSDERALAGRLDGGSGFIAWHLDAFDRESSDIDIPDFATADPAQRPEEEQRGTVLNSAGASQGFAGGFSLIGERGFIGISLSDYENDYGLPGPEEEGEEEEEGPLIAPGPFIELQQTRVDMRGEYEFGGVIEKGRFRFGHNNYEHSEIEPNGEVATLFENDAWEGRVELVHAPIGNWRGAVGLQLNDRDFSAVGEEAFVPPTETTSFGLFLLEELQLASGRIEFGARLESLQHTPDGALPDYDDTALSLAAGANWDIAEDYDLGVNLSRSERHPDSAELYSNGAHLATGLFEVGLFAQGATQVEKEVATNIDVSVHHHSDTLSWRISVFYNDIADYTFRSETQIIEDGLPLTPYAQQGAEFYGYEAELEVPLGGDYAAWNIRLFTDYVRGKASSGDLPRIPPARFGAQLTYADSRWSGSLETIYHAEQDDISTFQTDSFTMLNVGAALKLGDDGPLTWDLFVKGSNLLDEDARRSTSFRAAFVPLPGASLHAGVRASFN